MDSALKNVFDAVASDPTRLWTIKEMAEEVGVSKQRIHQLYKEGKLPPNVMPQHHLIDLRIERAVRKKLSENRKLGIDAVTAKSIKEMLPKVSEARIRKVIKSMGVNAVTKEAFDKMVIILKMVCGKKMVITKALAEVAGAYKRSPHTLQNRYYKGFRKYFTKDALECIKMVRKLNGRKAPREADLEKSIVVDAQAELSNWD